MEIPGGLLFANHELEIDQRAISYIDRQLVIGTLMATFPCHLEPPSSPASKVFILCTDASGNLRPSIPLRESFERMFGQHPVHMNRNKISPTLPITVCNLSLWQDGLSGNASKKWNPHEACLMSLAGLPRKVGEY